MARNDLGRAGKGNALAKAEKHPEDDQAGEAADQPIAIVLSAHSAIPAASSR